MRGLDRFRGGDVPTVRDARPVDEREVTPFRPATVGIVLLSVAFLSVFYSITDVVGGSVLLIVEVAVVLVAATVLGRRLAVREALLVSVALFFVGGTVYWHSVPHSQRALLTVGALVRDTIALLTGLSVLRLLEARVWALTLMPAPLFATWYLAVRGRAVASTMVGAGTLGFFVLTGDAGLVTTLVGVVGATLAVGLGTLDLRGAVSAQWDTVVLVVAVMVVFSATMSVVPGGSASPAFNQRTTSVETNLVSNQDRMSVLGSVRLSPQVRFEVRSEEPGYWRVGAYDRYTGDGWVRSGDTTPYEERLGGPPGRSDRVEQTVIARTPLDALPALWKPVRVRGQISRATQVTSLGGLSPGTAVEAGERYTVISEVPDHTPGELRGAGTDYPAEVQERYTQLPDSTSDRLRERSAQVTADADNPYEAAVAIERYLKSEKEYSLSVQRPDGNVADAFLFEMDAGYCVYFATTMAVMLRSQGIPARVATGYTPGERVAEDEWVVRGLDSHAWVEVYFPDVGWVQFDPTPSAARESAEDARIAEARQNEEEGVDTDETGPEEWTPTATKTPAAATTGTVNGTAPEPGGPRGLQTPATAAGEVNGTVGNGTFPTGEEPDATEGVQLPDRETTSYLLALLVGLIAGVRRFGLADRVGRAVRARYQPRVDPRTDAVTAYLRLEYLLERRYRERRAGETPTDYLAQLSRVGVDDAILRVGAAYEQARYGGEVDEATASEAVATVDRLAWRWTPLIGRIFGGLRGGS